MRSEYGVTIFLTTHLMEEADSLCNRVAILHLGKMAALGTPDTLKRSIGKEGATLDDVFIHFAGSELQSGGDYREASRARRVARRVG
jgi:ABC-2 type transport system ATP-binding protein